MTCEGYMTKMVRSTHECDEPEVALLTLLFNTRIRIFRSEAGHYIETHQVEEGQRLVRVLHLPSPGHYNLLQPREAWHEERVQVRRS